MRWLAILFLTGWVTAESCPADETLSEVPLYGTMDAGSRRFRFRIETIKSEDNSVTHQLVSLDEGGQVFRLDPFRLDESQLQFDLKVSKATYSGQVSDDGATIRGKWHQSGQDFDLDFRRMQIDQIPEPVEVWSGNLNSLFQKLQVRIRVYRDKDGSEEVFFDSISQKVGGFRATRTIDNTQWSLKVEAIGGTFDGNANEDNSEVKGSWRQGGITLDLTLTPELSETREFVEPPSRPQTPVAPFPYHVEEVQFRNHTDQVTLSGTLTLPKTDQPCTAVVMISGSGPQDRDESLLDHKPFWVIADHLSRHGIAVLRFDDRGTGASTGDFSGATSEDFARDVEGAIDFLLKDTRIAPRAIGLIGHSEGGMIAPMVAASNPNLSFIVLMAGTGVNGKEILISQGQLILKAQGVNDETLLETQRATQLAMIETILASPADAPQETLINAVMERLSNLLPAETLAESTLKTSVAGGIERMQSPWFRYFLTHEPAVALQKVKCPVLALNGEKDVQVDPELNLPAIDSALRKGGNSRFRTIEFPGLNHLFQTCTTGGLNEYQTIEETIAPVVLQTIADWILDVTKSN